uniref:Asteroid domain-containing protein n=1 Tax=Biomphalaria glabrata TaxID=6526 RepID=A0A2C9L3L0_BIOGL
MGVHKLWSYVKQNKAETVAYVDLIELAKSYPEKMNILIDFYCFEHFLTEKFLASLGNVNDIDSLIYAGGEYKLMDRTLRCLILELRRVNIEPIFYLDGAKGSADISTKQKMQTWKNRYLDSQKGLKNVFFYLRGERPLTDVNLSRLTRPCLQEMQNVLTLQDLGCKMFLRVSGEADYMIAKDLMENQNAFCVLSNDTDFTIFPDSVLLPQDMFDLTLQLGQGLSSFEPRVPENLICGIIRTENVMNLLKLPDHRSLIEVAIIGGNDFTMPILSKHSTFMYHYKGNFQNLSSLINQSGCIEKCDFFGELMFAFFDTGQLGYIATAVQHSRQFYSLSLPDEEEPEKGYSFNVIADNIRLGKLPSTIVSMHRGIYWHRQVITVCWTICVYIDVSGVFKATDDRIPSLAEVTKNTFSSNLKLFELIIQHQEFNENKCESYFKQFGIQLGFIGLLLRYFLCLNWNQNLYISPEEFYVLVAWILAEHDTFHYYKLRMKPSPRCMTMASWFQALYRNAYAFLGNILDVSHEFPSPRDLFSFSTWVALYTSCFLTHPNPTFRLPCPLHVSVEEMLAARLVVVETVQEYKNFVKKIIDGFFPLDTRILQEDRKVYL